MTVELSIGGMSCASCATRIEKRLNQLDGVTATVNYATERATVDHSSAVDVSDLVAVVAAAGYSVRDSAAESDTAPVRLLVSAVLALPVLVFAMVSTTQFTGWQWISSALATPVVLWGGWPFHHAAWLNLRHRTATMDTLVSMGTLAAYGWSLYAVIAGPADMRMRFAFTASDDGGIYFEIASVVVVFLLTGRLLEARAKRRSGAALRALLELGAKDVGVIRDGVETRISAAAVRAGDLFVVRPGEKIGTDGVVLQGSSAVDASLLTGESMPIEVGPGDAVTGATINAGGRLVVRATRVGADTRLAQLARLVVSAQSGKAPVQRLADRVSAVFVPAVLVFAALTLAISLAAGIPPTSAFTAAVAVLIVACPCALGLATPTALLVGTGRGAQLGLVIKGPQVLESTRRIDTIVLDKTGTVTSGRMAVHAVEPPDVLRWAGAVEAASEHPVAAAIAAAAREQYGALPAVDGFSGISGQGVIGVIDGVTVVIGRSDFLAAHGLSIGPELLAAIEVSAHTVVLIGWDGAARGYIAVGDAVKSTSAQAVRELRALGLHPVLLTGDNRRTARAVADEVGIDEVISEVTPEEKVGAIRDLQRAGRVTAMVGDGVNDAAALAQADLGLAIGGGTDVAIEASDITLVRGDLRAAADGIRLSRRTLRIIKGNLFWAFAYNVVLIPVAAAGLLSPLFAGAAMAFSSMFVVSNSLRLRRFRPT